jgi:hypothetical protein
MSSDPSPAPGDPSNLLVAAAVASFDMVSGIKLAHRWRVHDHVDPHSLEDVFKITLSNVHRQSESAYSEGAISTVDIQSLSWFVVNSIFILARKPRSIYYSVGLVFDTRHIPDMPQFVEILVYWCKILSRAVRHSLIANIPLNAPAFVPELILSEIGVVVLNALPKRPPFSIAPADNRLNYLVLTSHFQTQMTTVIETGSTPASIETGLKIGRFLAQFLLPFQLHLSTLNVLPQPSRHLYLQLVERQTQDHELLTLAFGKAVTWVVLNDKEGAPVTVWRYGGCSDDQQVHDAYIEATVIGMIAGDDRTARLDDLKKPHRKTQVVTPAPWAVGTVTLINWVPRGAQAAICKQQLGAMVRCAISIVAIVREKQVASSGATVEQYEREIQRALKLTGNGADWEMAFGVAQLYDRGIVGALDAGSKKGLAKSLSSY